MLTQNYRSIPIIDRFTKKSFFRCRTQGGRPFVQIQHSQRKSLFFPLSRDKNTGGKGLGKKRLANAGFLTQEKEVKYEE
jgi:hypothetical protein